MDLNVKLQGLKHNLEKVRGVFAKFQGPGCFLEFWIYFPIEKGVEYVYGSVDRVHGAGARVYRFLIQRGPFNPRWTHEIRTRKGMFSWS
jgi:hypothetical protein